MDQLPCCQGNGVNTTFCKLARDALLSNRNTEKMNFDTNYITILISYFNQENIRNPTKLHRVTGPLRLGLRLGDFRGVFNSFSILG